MTNFYVFKTMAYMEAENKEEAWQKFKAGNFEEVECDPSLSDVEKE